MRKRRLHLIVFAAVLSLAAPVNVFGEEAAAAPQSEGQPVAPQKGLEQLHAVAEIDVSNREHPLWFYKRICLEEVIPQFLAEVKKENPDLDEKQVAKEIVAQINQPAWKIEIYVRRGKYDPEGRYAEKLATMALRRFNALDQSERMKLMSQIAKEKGPAEKELKDSEDKVKALDRELSRLKADTELWRAQLASYTTQLAEAELKKAELETKLKLLSEKAAQVKDTVSTEEIGALEKVARELELQIDEPRTEDAIRKCAMILQQKEQDFKRTTDLHKQNLVSQDVLEKAQFELEMARADYDQAKRLTGDLKGRLQKVKFELATARDKFAQTGGLGLATIIAEKTLESETELATVQGRIRLLQDRLTETEQRVSLYRNLEAEGGETRSGMEQLRKRLSATVWQEVEIQRRVNAGAQISKSPDRYLGLRGFREIPEEQPGMYEVTGEVKKPGSIKLQPETTLLKAIEAAGGLTADADAQNVFVLRALREDPKTSIRHVVDCKAIMDGKSPDDFIIEPDDMVIVPRKEPAK